MKEFDPKKWVDDTYVRKAYAELKLDYDAELASYEELRDLRRGQVLQEADHRAAQGWRGVGRRRGHPAVLQRMLHARRLCATSRPRARRSTSTYVFDTARGIKLFADQAFFAVGGGKIATVPAEEGRRGLCRQEQRQGAGLRRRGEGRRRAEARREQHRAGAASAEPMAGTPPIEAGTRPLPAPSPQAEPRSA